MSSAMSLSKQEVLHILKVVGFVAASAVVTKLIQLVPTLHFDANDQMVIMGVLNVLAVFLTKFVPNTQQ